ncbi:MAG: M23 family metallopeptidase [Omnitrophica WOR_2 bacterium]
MSFIKRSFSIKIILLASGVIILVAGFWLYRRLDPGSKRSANVLAWLHNPQDHPDWVLKAGQRCGSAPFLFPTDGFAGYLWRDTFRIGQRHQGIDIFGGAGLDQTPVVSAYSGYLTRLPDWKASLIIRIPQDPLQPGRQIWTYYTHMADPKGSSFISPDFPPGTNEVFVQAGTLLGRQGNFSGTPGNPTGIHLHFSIVKDDGQGKFLNELNPANTLDPSPYLGLSLNADNNPDEIPTCKAVKSY